MDRSPIAAAAVVIPLLLLTACSSGSNSYSDSNSVDPSPVVTTPIDPDAACATLVAAPKGLAQQRARELGCVLDANGHWIRHVETAAGAAERPRPDPETQPSGGISWNEAVGYAGTAQRVCGPLAGGGNSEDDVFLNLGRDYPDPRRFQIVIWDIGSLDPIDGGVTLCTSGPITLYNGVAQIELTDPSLIEIYN